MQSREDANFLAELPEDILFSIFHYLKNTELANFARLSQWGKTVSAKDKVWRPRLFQEFNTAEAKSFANFKDYYAVLDQERKRLVAGFSFIQMAEQIRQCDKKDDYFQVMQRIELYKKFCQEYLPDIIKNPSMENLQAIANKIKFSADHLETEIKRADKLLLAIFKIPVNFFTQTCIWSMKVSSIYQLKFDELEKIFLSEIGYSIEQDIRSHIAGLLCLIQLMAAMNCRYLIESFLVRHPDLTTIVFHEEEKASLLHTAIYNGHYDLAKFLVENGSNVNLAFVYKPEIFPENEDAKRRFVGLPTYSPLLLALNKLIDCDLEPRDRFNEAKQFILFLLNRGADTNRKSLDYGKSHEHITPYEKTTSILCDSQQFDSSQPSGKPRFNDLQETLGLIVNRQLRQHYSGVYDTISAVVESVRSCALV